MTSRKNERQRFKSKKCFFITPIGDDDAPEHKAADSVLHDIINPVLKGLGMPVAKRADLDPHQKSIPEVLANDLIESDLVIADLSGGNPNVFYELGIRHAVDRPCVHLLRKGEKVAFDVNAIKRISYELTASGAGKAKAKLEEVIRRLFAPDATSQRLLGNDVVPLRRPSDLQVNHAERFAERTRAHHQLIHTGRDICLSLMGPNPRRFVVKKESGELPSIKPLRELKTELRDMLDSVVEMFQLLMPPGVKVWAAIRDRRADDQYHTFLRAGPFKKDRSKRSQPLHKDSPDVNELRRSTEEDLQCVVITGSDAGPDKWQKRKNDGLGEDKSVLMGAVCAKSPYTDSSGLKIEIDKLMLLLFVSCGTLGAFSRDHIPLMQCCNDVFSMVINAMLRSPMNDANAES